MLTSPLGWNLRCFLLFYFAVTTLLLEWHGNIRDSVHDLQPIRHAKGQKHTRRHKPRPGRNDDDEQGDRPNGITRLILVGGSALLSRRLVLSKWSNETEVPLL